MAGAGAGSGKRKAPSASAGLARLARGLLLLALAPLKLASLLVPRDPRLVLFGAGRSHVDNVLGILLARPGPPPDLRIRVFASSRHRSDARLLAAVAALPRARMVARWSPRAVWACLRAGLVLLPDGRTDVWRFWLGRARLVYINHGPWLKEMEAPAPQGLVDRAWAWLFGRYVLALACHDGEVADYQRWLSPEHGARSFGYPRSPLLDLQARKGLDASKVGLYPTWKPFDDPGYGPDLARRVQATLVAAKVRHPCTDFRPHHLTGIPAVRLGEADDRLPGLVVTDFSSVALDHLYAGGAVLLYSQAFDRFLATRGIRVEVQRWLRTHLVEDEDELLHKVRTVVAGKAMGVPSPFDLRPFDSAAFWPFLLRLADGKAAENVKPERP